jgi:hypothetical protein
MLALWPLEDSRFFFDTFREGELSFHILSSTGCANACATQVVVASGCSDAAFI